MADEKITLKPCPFCGGRADFATSDKNWISCTECGAETSYYDEPEEAIEAWERRYQEPTIDYDEMHPFFKE